MKIVSLVLWGLILNLACDEPTLDTPVTTALDYSNTALTMKNFYDFKTTTLSGETFDFSDLKDKRVLIVNTASECGYTPQYKQLQELYDLYGGEKFIILGFPSNDFGKQEPGSNEDIKGFCEKNFGVSFPMMEKNPVSGDNKQAVFQWITQKELNGVSDAKVSWNFNKFLVDENGKWVAAHSSSLSPLDERIVKFAKGS